MKLLLVFFLSLLLFACSDSSSFSLEDYLPEESSSSMQETPFSSETQEYSSCQEAFSSSSSQSLWIYSSSVYPELDSAWDALNTEVSYDEFTDARDGHVYRTVDIDVDGGVQTWMAQNLNYEYEDGKQSWCANGSQYDTTLAGNCEVYGRLYTFASLFMKPEKDCGYIRDFCDDLMNCPRDCDLSAMKDENGNIRGICPEGFHLPSLDEFILLGKAFADSVDKGDWTFYGAGVFMLADVQWDYSYQHENLNATGFSVIPAGSRNLSGYTFGKRAFIWTATEQDDYRGYGFRFAMAFVEKNGLYEAEPAMWRTNENRRSALSVRCIRD